ncbi:hypothetical protein [Streptomyces sp. TLI_171]|uniref:hypothetical protein n=1 Tax=Streptomyces sp. TLI_171 TaxID=1938859 RepID=UPI000C17C18D|nr:hypothetical protein [Streptomyces sp. TLI_171]RKE23243.1 hypothetical protein BX266_6704 [Streptomyces sp. TLI_171]
MTRRERFRLYAAEHFTAPDESAVGLPRCRGTVERQTSRSRLASLARIAPQHAVPPFAAGREVPVSGQCRPLGRAVLIPAQRTCQDGAGRTEGRDG